MMMISKTTTHGWMLSLLSALFLLSGLTACGSSSDETDGGGDFIQVPGNEGDTWVKDDDIKDADLDLLVELAVKAERMRQEFVLMLSNGGVGDKPFCGVGIYTDAGPTIRLMTEILEKQDEYREAFERLDGTDILKPTCTRGKLKDMWDIITCGKTEAEREKEIVQEVLTANNVYGNAEAQKQLYDFYCSQEPERAKKIGATDAKDFFNKLNNGDLNDYMLNISHIWRDKGIEKANETGNAVGDYAYTAFTGKAEYLNSAYRVGGKAAVAAGKLYFTAVDNLAGGFGSKIIDFGDAIQNQITRLKLMKKTLEGKPDWQGWNSYLVDNLKGDLKDAITGAIGDDDSFGKDLVDMVSEEILGWIAEQCTSNDNGDGSEKSQQKKEEVAKVDDIAIINIETDYGSQGKMVIITDESTGNFHVATPNADGRLTISTTPGNKLITIIKNNGERLTKQIKAVAGTNTVTFKTGKAPYIETNPHSITIDGDGSKELAYVLTNCKYVKYRQTSGSDWCKVDMKIYYGKSGQLTPENSVQLTAEADANNEDKERNATIVLEGYNDNSSNAKPVATYNVKVTQGINNLDGKISVSPSTLKFDANGGEQNVQVTVDKMEYFGGYVEDDNDTWITVSTAPNTQLVIKVSANNTGEKRSGIVYAYATNVTNPTYDDIIKTPITITQEATNNDGLNDYELDHIDISTTLGVIRENDGFKTWHNLETQTFYLEDVKMEQRGESMHFEAYKKWKKSTSVTWETTCKLSFDIENMESKDGAINNVVWDFDHNPVTNEDYDYGRITLHVEATDLKDQTSSGSFNDEGSIKYKGQQWITRKYGGKNYSLITYAWEEHQWWDINLKIINESYKLDPEYEDNKVYIELTFKKK